MDGDSGPVASAAARGSLTMTTPLYVVIAACGQPALLARTLQSLTACDKPSNYAGALVVENGPPAGLEQIVRQFPAEQQIRYLYSQPANKSLALNRALAALGDALVVFTDDDVRFSQQTLLAYAAGSAGRSAGEFYGGPIVPDYETAPPARWLVPLLPRSAGGWALDVGPKTPIAEAEFIGPNWAAFARDVLAVGGFDTRLGPGSHMVAPGEDTEIQVRLLAHRVRGFYLPDAAMHHLVRAANVLPEFAFLRAERNGICWGISQAQQRGFFPRRYFKALGQWLNDRWRISRWRISGDEINGIRATWLAARWRGRWRGVRLGWNWQPIPCSPVLPMTQAGVFKSPADPETRRAA
jgi:GT2 family glycosyltransferase